MAKRKEAVQREFTAGGVNKLKKQGRLPPDRGRNPDSEAKDYLYRLKPPVRKWEESK